MAYDIKTVAGLVDLTTGNLASYIARGVVVLEQGRARQPKAYRTVQLYTRNDVYRIAWIKAMHEAARVPLDRCRLFLPVIEAALSRRADVVLWLRNRADFTDTDFSIGTELDFTIGSDPRPEGVPEDAIPVHVGRIKANLLPPLDRIDLEDITTDRALARWPFKIPFCSPVPGSAWSVFRLDTAGEPDDEAIARMCDAVERRDNVLLCGADKACLAQLVGVMDRLAGSSQVAA